MGLCAIHRVTLGAALLGALGDIPAMAEGLPITPGLWESRTRDLIGEADEVIEQHCIEEGVFDPAAEMAKDGTCLISNKKIVGNTMDFDVVCSEKDAMGFQGHFSSMIDGDRGLHESQLTVELFDSVSEIHTLSEWRRLGDC